jgi:proteasome accessory factor A
LFETADLRDTKSFVENGARLYLDGGDHPEYATPECDDVMELVAHDKAGERILAERLQRDVDFARLSKALVPFLVTRLVFAGAGKAYQTRDGMKYCLSQRGQRPVFETAAGPYPVIDTRDQPLADATRFRRLHVVIGDANMSEVATYLKVGTTALLLDMVEDGVSGPDLTLQSATSALQDISSDSTLRTIVRLQDGRRFTVLDLQTVERATRYVGSIGASAKTRFIGRHKLSWQDPKVGLLDLQYHDVRREEGIYARLVRRGAVDRMVDDHAVVHAQRNPPRTTRARLRGEFIRIANLSGAKYRVDWTYVRLAEDPEQQAVFCSDPFLAFDERVESLVRRMHLKAALGEVEAARDGEPAMATLLERADCMVQNDEVEGAGGTSDT